ncbi:hypothetical protein GGF46_000336 [Coemansia sp. RSA 552]|nr:hypothetical protein GGF46_000336 [Coemansia sp. RSA 552]
MKRVLALTIVLLATVLAEVADTGQQRLIALDSTRQEWMPSSKVMEQLVGSGQRFRDITDFKAGCATFRPTFPTAITTQEHVQPLLSKVSDELPKRVLKQLTEFPNRYFNSTNGQKSSEFLYGVVGEFANTTRFTHAFPQASVIARIPGASRPEEIVVVSAHQDSINGVDVGGRAPGADDDGSGSVTILEALRILSTSSLRLQRSVEFHWYAGEEGGLLGSADIAQAYCHKPVVADLHFDMTGFPKSPAAAVGIVVDHTDPDTSDLVRQLVGEYTDLPAIDFQCGYACSDHASWHESGVRSALPFESQFVDGNANIHTPQDSYETVDFDHLLNYVRIALGFIVEVAGVD